MASLSAFIAASASASPSASACPGASVLASAPDRAAPLLLSELAASDAGGVCCCFLAARVLWRLDAFESETVDDADTDADADDDDAPKGDKEADVDNMRDAAVGIDDKHIAHDVD